jgi:hypothetical protein
MATLLAVLGPVDGGGALQSTLTRRGLGAQPGPLDAGDQLAEQLRAGRPLDAYTWWRLDTAQGGATLVRLLPGTDGGLEPSLAEALSRVADGDVLAMEATRTRDRYLVGRFRSGRVVRLSRSVGGVTSGPDGEQLHDDGTVTDLFEGWLRQALGAEAPVLAVLDAEPTGALLASPWEPGADGSP